MIHICSQLRLYLLTAGLYGSHLSLNKCSVWDASVGKEIWPPNGFGWIHFVRYWQSRIHLCPEAPWSSVTAGCLSQIPCVLYTWFPLDKCTYLMWFVDGYPLSRWFSHRRVNHPSLPRGEAQISSRLAGSLAIVWPEEETISQMRDNNQCQSDM